MSKLKHFIFDLGHVVINYDNGIRDKYLAKSAGIAPEKVAEISNLSIEDRNNYLGELRTYLSKYTSVEKWRDGLLSVYNKDGDNVWLPTNLSPSKGV